jgi:ATP-dependent Lhr-like helicase
LERIHRQTLSMLRKEVEPVSLYAYADFLARWQHLHPAERLEDPGALVRMLQQMRGVPAPGVVWERDLLPQRLRAFDPGELEALCRQGEVVWAGSGGKDPRRARVRFLFRGEGHLFLAPEGDGGDEEEALSPAAIELLEFLKAEGASFFADLEEGLAPSAGSGQGPSAAPVEGPSTGLGQGLSRDQVSEALVELVMAGLVTNDSLEALRGVLAWSAESGGPKRKPLSSLEAELAAWRKEQAPSRPGTRPSRGRLHAARQTVSRRVPAAEMPRWPGRWSLVHRIGVWGREVPFEERIARQARQLLQCYGIVTRQTLEGDPEGGWNWRALYAQFQLMEMRGEVRRGYFVQGLPGIQFALPEAVERLREWTRPPVDGEEELVVLNATDPANVFGPAKEAGAAQEEEAELEIDPARFTRIPSNYVVLLRGRPVLLLETGAGRVTALPDLPPTTLRRALGLAVEQAGRGQRRLTLSEWNGEAILESPSAPVLEAVGFRREALVYIWE